MEEGCDKVYLSQKGGEHAIPPALTVDDAVFGEDIEDTTGTGALLMRAACRCPELDLLAVDPLSGVAEGPASGAECSARMRIAAALRCFWKVHGAG